MEADVVVVGSGGAALTAAVSAAAAGAEVLVLEREEQFGGTTAFSGGGLWIPNNRFARAAGIADSREDALRYLRRIVNHTGLDLFVGDHSLEGPARTLRPLGSGPYHAVRVELGAFGTKGGPLTNADAQVLDLDERPIPGLYAAGNTAAHVFGAAYPGPGGTLGPALTFGCIAGRQVAVPR